MDRIDPPESAAAQPDAARDLASDQPRPDLSTLYRDALKISGGDTERAVAIALDSFLFRRGE